MLHGHVLNDAMDNVKNNNEIPSIRNAEECNGG
jgi:hypothetical protein